MRRLHRRGRFAALLLLVAALLATKTANASPAHARVGFGAPSGVAVDRQGNVFVADALNGRVVELSPSGLLLRAWPVGCGHTSGRPRGLALDRQGNVLVTDWDCVLKYSSHGRLLAQFGRAGDGEFAGASAIALGGGGNIFVATGRQSIEKLSPSGYVLATWPVYLNDYFSLGPGSIAVDALGQVYSTGGVSETGIVQKRAPDGRLLAHWTVKGRLSGIAVGRRGNVFVGTYRFPDPAPIYKLSPTGQPLATWSYPHVTEARAIAVDRRGDLYLACDNDDAIVKLSSSGRELAIWK